MTPTTKPLHRSTKISLFFYCILFVNLFSIVASDTIDDITKFNAALEAIKEEVGDLSSSSSSLQTDLLPVLGESLPDVLTEPGRPFSDLVDWTGFASHYQTKFGGAISGTVETVRDSLEAYILQQETSPSNTVRNNTQGQLCQGATSMVQIDPARTGDRLSLTLCIALTYNDRVAADLTGTGMLEGVGDGLNLQLDLSDNIIDPLDVTLALAFQVEIDVSDGDADFNDGPGRSPSRIDVTVGAGRNLTDPVTISVDGSSTQVTSNTTALSLGYAFQLCRGVRRKCPSESERISGSEWRLSSTGGYVLWGTDLDASDDIALQTDDATFVVRDDHAFNGTASSPPPVLEATGWDASVFQGYNIRDLLTPVFTGLLDQFASFRDVRTLDLLYEPVPVVGKSVSELLVGNSDDTLDKVVDFVSFVEDTIQRRGGDPFMSLEDLRNDLLRHLGVEDVDTTVAPGNGCASPVDVAVDTSNQTLSFAICSALTYNRQLQLDASGLFRSVPDAIEIDLAANVDVDVQLQLAAAFTVSLDNPADFEFDLQPIVASLSLDANPSATLALGTLELTSKAQAFASATFVIEYCNDDPLLCPTVFPEASLLGNSSIYFQRQATYLVEGALSLGMDFANVEVGDAARFSLQDNDVFDDQAPTIEVENFDIEEFLKFTPANCIAFLRMIDSALVRGQEMEALQKANIPFTDVTVASLLATGSMLTSQLLQVFVRPTPFADRGQKSLKLTASKSVAEIWEEEGTENRNLNGTTLQLVVYNGATKELAVNPDEYDKILAEEEHIQTCNVTLDGNLTAQGAALDQELADILRLEMLASCNELVVCEPAQCSQDDEGDFFDCACDVVVGQDSKGLVYIANVAYQSEGLDRPQDVQLLGLYNASSPFEESAMLGLPLNSPAVPALIPRFRNFQDFTSLLSTALSSYVEGLSVEFQYVPSGESYSRFEVEFSYRRQAAFGATFDGSVGIGDLVDIRVDPSDSSIDLTLDAGFETSFGVILGSNEVEELIVLGEACGGNETFGVVCDGDALTFKLEYEESGIKQEDIISVPQRINASAVDVFNSALGGYANVSQQGTNLLLIRFNPSVGMVDMKFPKDCNNTDDVVVETNVFECSEKEYKARIHPNSYELSDQVLTKKPFQLAVGDASVTASLSIQGSFTLFCTVLDVIEVSASVGASITGTLEVGFGDNGKLLRFTDWLSALTSALNPQGEGFIGGFLTASATFDGEFSGTVAVGAPFDSFIDPISASGEFTEPYVLNFLDIKGSGSPNVDMQVDLPSFGDVRKLSFENVVEILGNAIKLLIGDGEEDDVQSCSGGLLGRTILGKNVFQYQIPVLGISVCNTARFLGVFVEMVENLSNEVEENNGTSTTTFNAMGQKLTSLLQDGVGGTPTVNLTTTSNPIRSEMVVDIELHWSFSELFQINVDLESIMSEAGSDTTSDPDIANFAKNLVAGEGEGNLNLDAGLSFRLGVGLEYVSAESRINSYILGTTGLIVSMDVEGGASYEIQAGPLSGFIDLSVDISSAQNPEDPLSLKVALDEQKKYYLGDPGQTSSGREGFETVSTIGSLVDELGVSFDGAIRANMTAGLSLIGLGAAIDVEVSDLDALFRGMDVFSVLSVNPRITDRPSFSKPTLLDLLLEDPQGLLETLDTSLSTLEGATLGRSGIVSNFPVPFVRQGLGRSLGAGTDQNIIAQGRRRIIPGLQEGLATFEADSSTAAELLGNLIQLGVESIGLLQEEKDVLVECFSFDNDLSTVVDCTSKDPEPSSVMWSVPFGQSLSVSMPLDFDLDAGSFPLEIQFGGEDGNAVPTLSISWSFDLAFGYDDDAGFFLFTFPDSGQEEFQITALLSVLDRDLFANLIFLKGSLKDLDLSVGAKLAVDIDKEKALGTPELSTDRQFGRLTIGKIKSLPKIGNMFSINALAAATVAVEKVEFELNTDFLPDNVAKFVPKLNAKIGLQARKKIGLFNARRKLLSTSASKIPRSRSLEMHSDHRAYPLLRSLSGADDILGNNFSFEPCELTGTETFCGKVKDVKLDMKELKNLVIPIVKRFIRVDPGDEKGFLDQVVDPQLLVLDQRLPGISDVLKRKVTVLDIAEAFIGKRSGAPTVRKILKIYRQLQDYASRFNSEDDEGLLLASSCDMAAGFKCSGGSLTNEGSQRRLLHNKSPSMFHHADAMGLPMTPSGIVEEERDLASCASSFQKPNCAGQCTCASFVEKSKCRAKRVACRGGSIDGLTFPFMNNLPSVLGLLSGKDIDLVRFTPPTVVFAFEFQLLFVLWTPPIIELVIRFEFTVSLRVGFNLDTMGIRQAVEQKAPLKALNSFALMDTFDGVDEAMIIITASVTISLDVNFVIVKAGVSGAITFRVTVDLFDPNPETSRGLVRPFELLSLGSSPLSWFEFSLEIFITIKIYVKIGLFFGFIKITLFKYEVSFQFPIIPPLKYQPRKPAPPATLAGSGELSLGGGNGPKTIECTGLSGTVAEETIECTQGSTFASFSGVKQLKAGVSNHEVVLRGVKSEVNLDNYKVTKATLDYQGEGAPVLANNMVSIKGNEIVAGNFVMKYSNLDEGALILPNPEQEPLSVTVGGECSTPWDLSGHSNIVILAHQVKSGCSITSTGGEATTAILTIDFGYQDLADCEDGNMVQIRTLPGDSSNIEVLIKRAPVDTITVTVAKAFTDIIVRMSKCKDEVIVEDTPNVAGSVSIYTGGDADTITIGKSSDSGLDSFHKAVYVNGGSGVDTFVVNDSGSLLPKSQGFMNSASVLGILAGGENAIEFESIEDLEVLLSNGPNDFLIFSTSPDSRTSVSAGESDDSLRVNETQGDLTLRGGAGNDTMYVYGLAEGFVADIYGQDGGDELWIDGFLDPTVNLLVGSKLRWSGGEGRDTLNVLLGETGEFSVDIFDDLEGFNVVNINCTDADTLLLSRENFLANIHNISDPATTVQRINLVRDFEEGEWKPTAKIDQMVILMNEGENEMHFDDTIAAMDVYGGDQKDVFKIGQLYNSVRGNLSNVAVNDPIETTLTTSGYLSNGNSHPITLNGVAGDDTFDVLRNKQLLDLNGGSDDDVFTIRSMVNLEISENGTLSAPVLGDLKLKGDNGTDLFDFKGEDPDYVVNSLVDVDGGTGDDRLIVVGTDLDDSYVVVDGKVFGGGLTISYTNIESLELSGEEGNDLVTVLSTSPTLATYIYGSEGSDRFVVTPREVEPVVSKNLRGHRGILEHQILSADAEYNGLYTKGVAVEILDNDNAYVNIYETEPFHLMSEDSTGDFSFWVYPSVRPLGTPEVSLVAPVDPNGVPYVKLNNEPGINLELDSTTPQEVRVTYNQRRQNGKKSRSSDSIDDANTVQILDITELNLLIKNSLIATSLVDPRFKRAEQTLLPINIKLIPGLFNLEAKAVTVHQPHTTGKTVVVEGPSGYNAFYEVYLRPCTNQMKSDTFLTIEPTVDGQVTVSTPLVDGNGWGLDCKVTVQVDPIDDQEEEGLHFVTLRHKVRDGNDNPVLLSDGNELHVENILVEIHDDDVGSVILQESVGVTATMEINEFDKTSALRREHYQDSYTMRLSKKPSDDVTVTVRSKSVASDRPGSQRRRRGKERNKGNKSRSSSSDEASEERIQALVGLQDTTATSKKASLTFTPENWDQEQVVHVAAKNDNVREGVDWLNFPPQPSQLSYVQGPVILSGETSFLIPEVPPPIMLPGENDTDTFIIPENAVYDDSFIFIQNENQVDHLQIYNLDVRGNKISVGFLTDTQLTGFNMASNIVIRGEALPDGVTYQGMNVVELFLGDGSDDLTVVNTTEVNHFIHLGDGDDVARVKTIDGPFIINGGGGDDSVEVASDSGKLDTVRALLGVDGGAEGNGQLLLDNVADPGVDEVLNVTRSIVEVTSMALSPSRSNLLPTDSYIIKLRGAESGNFSLGLDDPVTGMVQNITVPAGVSTLELESLIQRALIPDDQSCGSLGISRCSNAVKVWQIGDAFAIFFVGERLNENVRLQLFTDGLQGFVPEIFQNKTNDYLFQNSDVVYANLDAMDIRAGDHDIVVNVRGTTAATTVTTQGGDDTFFVSSEANQNTANAGSVDFLHGWLDYIEKDLSIVAQSGRHRLMISDERSAISKGLDSSQPAVLTKTSFTNIHPQVGDIYFTADEGHWSDGVTIWLGSGDDRLDVESIPSNPNAAPLRTTTSIHCGSGNDFMTVNLDEGDHDGAVFIANGQRGNDNINASASSLNVILFGDGGDDTLIGGSGNDVLMGDYGRVVWRSSDNIFNPDGVTEAIAGQGGYGDFADGIIRDITDVYSVAAGLGGSDTLIMNGGDDVGIGGAFNDSVSGGDGNDIIFGDSAEVQYYIETTSPKLARSVSCENGGNDVLSGGPGEVDYIVGGGFNDSIEGNDGMDLVMGDHASISFYLESHKLQFATTVEPSCTGGSDEIHLGNGDDIAFGGAHGDLIHGDAGQDIILGDFGLYDAEVQFLPFQHYKSDIHHYNNSGDDELYGGEGNDFIMGQEGEDYIDGGGGRDDIYGGHHIRTGKDSGDTILGGDDADVILGDNGEIIRQLESSAGSFPWVNGMVWTEYPDPFDDEVAHDIRRYDDIDYVEGDDTIYGGPGNDILHGQRGDDTIFGGDGEDELYGELGSDTLDGGSGNDIVLGDIGYAVRRFERSGLPLLQDETRSTDSRQVWHKDIVLEELGNITGMDRISTRVETGDLTIEDVMSASMLFVATAIKEDGTKFSSANNGGWLTQLIRFQLVGANNDILSGGDGDDILIGQRGNDVIRTGEGNDLAIGDAGWSTIPVNMDMPRIYQIYRALKDTGRTELIVDGASDFGITFTSDFELYPGQYESVGILSSIIDTAVNVDDVKQGSNLLRDVLGVSAIGTSRNYCLQPMFRVTPGFLDETQWMHGNDEIIAEKGDNIVIGDDVRGFTGLDMTEISHIQDLRQRLHGITQTIGRRLSTMEVDREHFEDNPQMGYDIYVASDKITTDIEGHSFVSGDSLTITGRSVKTGSLMGRGLFGSTALIDGVLGRFQDIELALLNLDFCLFELHGDLLRRMRSVVPEDQKPNQVSLHHLHLANDVIDSHGNDDVAMGDSGVLYYQADRPGRAGFEFNGLRRLQAFRVQLRLRRLVRSRDRALDRHVRLDLRKTADISRSDVLALPYADVPFKLTVATDTFQMNDAENIAAGDFATIGTVVSARRVPDEIDRMEGLVESIQNLRRPPRLESDPQASLPFALPLYSNRYSSSIAADTKPSKHGDNFEGRSRSNSVAGEFITGFTYQTFSSGEARFGVGDNYNTYQVVAAADEYAGDTFDFPVGSQVDGQLGADQVVGDALLTDADLETSLTSHMRALFFNHRLISQMQDDMWYERINERELKGVKTGFQCVDATRSSYIPSGALDDIEN